MSHNNLSSRFGLTACYLIVHYDDLAHGILSNSASRMPIANQVGALSELAGRTTTRKPTPGIYITQPKCLYIYFYYCTWTLPGARHETAVFKLM